MAEWVCRKCGSHSYLWFPDSKRCIFCGTVYGRDGKEKPMTLFDVREEEADATTMRELPPLPQD